jgi:hypothetical protein
VRAVTALVAALVLIAPSCPRDYGPQDYDPDATRSFAPGAGGDDLVYVAAGSAKGESEYVVAMPRGETLMRIDGPDRRGWAFASPTLAYYPMLRASANLSNTVHRIDLRSGSRARVITDDRPGFPLLEEAARSGRGGPGFTTLAVTADGAGLFVARVLTAGPRVWIGRYDAATGALQAERSWPITAIAANARLAAAGELIVVVSSARTDSGSVVQEMRLLDMRLAEVAALGSSDLPADERCTATLQALDGKRWATVCDQPQGGHASVLVLDDTFRIASRVSLRLEVQERVIAWTAQGGSVAILTDRARHIRVNGDGNTTSTWLGEPNGRTLVGVAREIAPGIVVAHLSTNPQGPAVPEVALLEVATGRVLARAATTTAVDFASAADRLYVLLSNTDGLGPRLQRLDRRSLAPLGLPVALPQRDDVMVGGLIAVIPAR